MADTKFNPISKELLSEFISNFYGYGNPKGPYWFIGMEEGGGRTIEENYARILTWEKLGKPLSVDLIDYHIELGFTEHDLSKVQKTWTKIALILLILRGSKATTDERRYYQRHHLGRLNGNNYCPELMPMPSPSTGKWEWQDIFQSYFNLPDRESYFQAVAPNRITRLRQLIQQYKPKLVMFYSTGYTERWKQIIGSSDITWISISRFMRYGWIKRDGILYVISSHPTTKGVSNDNFRQLGEFIKNNLNLT